MVDTTAAIDASGMRWVCHPIRHAHKKTAILALVVTLTAVFIYLNTYSVGWTVFAVLMLALGVIDYIAPMEFFIDDWGVHTRLFFYRRRKPWSVLRTYHPDRNGVLLSPFSRQTRLETFRGIYIRFDGNRKEVMSVIKGRLERIGADSR